MASKGRTGARQPLSRRRPKKAAERNAARRTGRDPSASGAARRGKSKGRPAGNSRPVHSAKTRKPTVRAPRSLADRREHAAEVYRRLLALYPDAHCELDYGSPWQLLVATILSAQCTDRRVNMVTPFLFSTYPSPDALAAARQEDVEEIIRTTGFFRNKARNLIAMAGALVDRHHGAVPADMDELVALPGVGRKTANVVLGNACGINVGVVVDTHVTRLARRLGLSRHTDAVKIEQDLMALFEQPSWTMLSHLLIWHGRRLCHARKPLCDQCPLAEICPSAGVG